MPAEVLIEAVRLASIPCTKGQKGHQAVKHITDWWNATANPELRCAYGFSVYVKYGDDWLSGNPEERWVDAASWHRNLRPKAEATLLDGQVVIVFFKRSVDENEYSFDAKSVDGNTGINGGKWPEITGDGLVTWDSFEVLSVFPQRFPDVWAEVRTIGTNSAGEQHG
jgi:hypothetical protein